MISMTFKVAQLKFEGKKFIFDFNKVVNAAIKVGAKKYVRIMVDLIPVYSGMARGSLVAAGNLVGVKITPAVGTIKRTGEPVKSRFSTGIGMGSAEFRTKGSVKSFYFRSEVWYLNYNDQADPAPYVNLIKKGPWRASKIAQEKGKEAALIYLRRYFPKPSKYFKVTARAYHSPKFV